MGIGGNIPRFGPVDYADDQTELTSFSTDDVENATVEGRDFGSRTQGGISGGPPVALVVDYDRVGGGHPANSPRRRDYASTVRHGRGWIDGSPPAHPVKGTVFPQYRAGWGDAPANKNVRYIRRMPRFLANFNRVDYDPDLVGRERMPLPRWSAFAMRFTMRHEAGQFAQRFSGLHTRVQVRSRDRAYKMAPPRSSRLTIRRPPPSYGSRTQVLGSR